MGSTATLVLAALAHFIAIATALLAGYATYGREPRPPQAMPLQNKPPDDLSPGEVAALDAEGLAGSRAWTATLIDLISRGVVLGGPVAEIAGDGTAETGYGVVRVNEGRNLLEHEEAVRSLMERVVKGGPVARVDMRAAMRNTPHGGRRNVVDFRDGLRRRLTARAYAIVDAATFGWGVVVVMSVAAALMLLVLATINAADPDQLLSVALGVLIGSAAGAALASGMARRPALWVSRSDAGSKALGRWAAYRTYLETTLGDWPTDPIGVNRGDRTTAYACALGLMPAAEAAWEQTVPRDLEEEVAVA